MSRFKKSIRWTCAAALVIAAAVPAFAEKRRAVRHPSLGAALTMTVSGTITDSVTGLPVIAANVVLGNRSDRTDSQGKYKVTGTVYGTGSIAIDRSGYEAKTQEVGSAAGTFVVNASIKPTPTVRVRMTDGTVYDVDYEAAKFGYVYPFGDYISNDFEDFCTAGGEAIQRDKITMKRIVGPSTLTTVPGCCSTGQVGKVRVEFKSGETSDLFFADTCSGYRVDFISRNHVSGQFVYLRFTEIAEIIFP